MRYIGYEALGYIIFRSLNVSEPRKEGAAFLSEFANVFGHADKFRSNFLYEGPRAWE